MTVDRLSALQALGVVDRQTLRERTAARLREAITLGELSPGTHLAEIDLSLALEVSRGTLREALRHLQQEGLVQSDSRGRLSVRQVRASEVEDIFRVRAALEGLAFKLACELQDKSIVCAQLRAQLEKMDSPEYTLAEKLELDLDFHAMLCRAAGNLVLYESWLNLRGLARATMTAAGPGSARTNMAVQRHEPILEYLERGDVESGMAFLESHMMEASTRLQESLQ